MEAHAVRAMHVAYGFKFRETTAITTTCRSGQGRLITLTTKGPATFGFNCDSHEKQGCSLCCIQGYSRSSTVGFGSESNRSYSCGRRIHGQERADQLLKNRVLHRTDARNNEFTEPHLTESY